MSADCRLYEVCLLNNLAEVRHLVTVGYDVNIPNASGQTPLFAACIAGSLELVRFLLDCGASLNHQDTSGQTALHIALEYEHSYLAKTIIESYHPNLYIRDINNRTALHVAISKGLMQWSQYLTKYFDDDIGTDTSYLQLLAACCVGEVRIVRQLLECGTPVNEVNEQGSSALHVACEQNRLHIVNLLLDYAADRNILNRKCYTPLHAAVLHPSQIDIARCLLKNGANANIPDKDGNTPLHLAARQGDSDIANLLFQHGANKCSKNKDGLEPFELAFRTDRFNVIWLYLEGGYDMTHNLLSGKTPLYYCCKKGQTETVSLLLKKDVDVNQLCSRGSALDAAVDIGNVDIIEQLILAGADVMQQSRKHTTVLDRLYEQRDRYGKILKLVINTLPDDRAPWRDGNGETLLLKACRDGDDGVFDCLLKSGKNIGINTRNKLGKSPVYVLCEQNRHTLLSKFLRKVKDIDVDTADHLHLSPLHIACQHGELFIINMILRKSTQSLERKDKLERRPIHLVQRPEVISLLSEWNVELGCKNYLGQTPLLLHCLNGNRDMVSAVSEKLAITEMKPCDGMGRNIVHLCVDSKDLSILENTVNQARGLNLLDGKDINGQTGLHIAAQNDDLTATRLLLEADANPNIPDKSGLTPLLLSRAHVFELLCTNGAALDCVSIHGCDYDTMHTWREQMIENKKIDLFYELTTHGESYWETIVSMPQLGFIQAHPNQVAEFQQIKHVLRQFMMKLSDVVAGIDPLMEFELMPSGSMNEETKVGIPDEGDFVCILPKVSARLHPPSRFIFHTTYVMLSANGTTDDLDDFGKLVDTNGKLLTEKLFHRFYQAVGYALLRSELWEDFPQLHRATNDDINYLQDKISNVTLYWCGPVYKWIAISVDVVPAVYFEGWRPAWCADREVLQTSKCAVVAKNIKHAPDSIRKYLFQLCFTECDAAMFNLMIPELKKGYMVAKLARQTHICHIIYENDFFPLEPVSQYITSYMLKTATYHVYEDFKQDPKKIHFAEETSETLAAVACARMIFEKLEKAFEEKYLEMFFVPAFDIFRNHFESRHDQEVAKMYCIQLLNIVSKNPYARKYGLHFQSNVNF